jgi:hypothetical protein
MKHNLTRKEITKEDIEKTFIALKDRFNKKIEKKGNLGFVSAWEVYGKLSEEIKETLDELHNKDEDKFKIELMDVVITSILGILSL